MYKLIDEQGNEVASLEAVGGDVVILKTPERLTLAQKESIKEWWANFSQKGRRLMYKDDNDLWFRDDPQEETVRTSHYANRILEEQR